ncbi:hypothetical protein GCM10022223_05250 [Kineosporia mesophila]|uniref:HlyD family efflux transporter periplasmic adaptor subunit n=1 Tax=Kineosporia mesophila TaxID=566012 RepID=A0ABP6YZE7_9ACTN|nr:efflux RND transporter periplasmic adaptor subunit [Kineosporia mesophila]MCD5354266.1 efflux RND transporter periplasmic adaptor subunit [Kineosporia mesophila]
MEIEERRSPAAHGRGVALLGVAVVVALTGWLAWRHLSGAPAQASEPTPTVATVTQGPFSVRISLKASVTREDPVAVDTGGRDIAWTAFNGKTVYRGGVLGRSRIGSRARELTAKLAETRRDRDAQRDLAVLALADADRDIRSARRALLHIEGPGRTDAEEAVDAARDAREKLLITLNHRDAESTAGIQSLEKKVKSAQQRHRVTAPATGVFAMRGPKAFITADRYTLAASLSPEEAYRAMLLANGDALVGVARIPAGPTDFTCDTVKITQAVEDTGPARAVCQVPRRVRLVHDLDGTLEVTLWHTDDAVLVDAGAIENYDPAKGVGYVVLAASRARKKIEAGPSDGRQVVVLGGLTAGDQVMVD